MMTSNLIFLTITIILSGLILFYIFRLGGRTQKAAQEIIERREYQLKYCREILEVEDKVKYNGRECRVFEIKYLSEKICIQDLETGENLFNVDFTDGRLEFIPKN